MRRRIEVGPDLAVEVCSEHPPSPETIAALGDIARATQRLVESRRLTGDARLRGILDRMAESLYEAARERQVDHLHPGDERRSDLRVRAILDRQAKRLYEIARDREGFEVES